FADPARVPAQTHVPDPARVPLATWEKMYDVVPHFYSLRAPVMDGHVSAGARCRQRSAARGRRLAGRGRAGCGCRSAATTTTAGRRAMVHSADSAGAAGAGPLHGAARGTGKRRGAVAGPAALLRL